MSVADAGERLARRAQEMLALMETARAELVAAGHTDGGVLRVASFQTPMIALAPVAVSILEQRHPLLRIEIAHARAQGYACVDQELELGLRTIAVPLKNYRGDTVAALNFSVHAQRMTMDQLVEHCLPPLKQSQATLRQLL